VSRKRSGVATAPETKEDKARAHQQAYKPDPSPEGLPGHEAPWQDVQALQDERQTGQDKADTNCHKQ
jgi:hypothetical protein